ncbi:hypothetical protein ACVIQT_002080 [Bradyrhizobium diazoefficiens]
MRRSLASPPLAFSVAAILVSTLIVADSASAKRRHGGIRGALERGAETVQNPRETLENATKAVEKAGQDTGKTLEKASQDAAKTLEKAGQDTGNAFKPHPRKDDPSKHRPYRSPIQSADCPHSARGVSWKQYLSKGTAIAGVQFRFAKNISKDERALGGIDPAACYGVEYEKGKGFSSWRSFGYARMYEPRFKDQRKLSHLPGDPAANELNVDGLILRYNRAGDVLDLRGRRVGVLVCYLSNECDPYGY